MQDKGVFIVLEGSDGSGKTTQFKLLHQRLKDAGYSVEVFDFPRYDQPSSHFVKEYLNGKYGPAASISPYSASLFYALDRFEAAPAIKKALAAGKIVLADRFVGSNMAHQGSKFSEAGEKRGFFVWADSLEFQLLGIPRPDINLYLRVPADIAQKLIGQRDARSYTTETHDSHEKDLNHLTQAVETYDLLCQLFPKDFVAINSVKDGKLMPVGDIHEAIWQKLSPILPHLKKPNRSQATQLRPTQKVSSSNDIELTVREISYLAAFELKKLGLDISVDKTSPRSPTKFYSPDGLSPKLQTQYKQTLQTITELHQKALKQLRKSASKDKDDSRANEFLLLAMRPVSACLSLKLRIDLDKLGWALTNLSASRNEEIQKLSEQLRALVASNWPDRLQDSELKQSGPQPSALTDIIEQISGDILPQTLSDDHEQVRLSEVSPRNEFELIADSLYSASELSKKDISEEVDKWSYQKKSQVLRRALQQPEIAKLARYRFDILSSRLLLNSALKAGVITDIKTQATTPRFGYDVPEALQSSGADETLMEAFDLALDLYSNLQTEVSGNNLEYATLRGHKLRWQAILTAADLKAIMELPALRPLAKKMSAAVSDNHSLIAEWAAARESGEPKTTRHRARSKRARR